jgi:hypothetical protein
VLALSKTQPRTHIQGLELINESRVKVNTVFKVVSTGRPLTGLKSLRAVKRVQLGQLFNRTLRTLPQRRGAQDLHIRAKAQDVAQQLALIRVGELQAKIY